MASRGGKRLGAGRPRGSGLAMRSSAVAKRELESGKVLPLEVMLTAMRNHVDAGDWDRAAAVAEKCAPYVHARLASTTHTGAHGGPIQFANLKDLSDEQLAALEPVLAQLAAAAEAEA